MNISEVKKKIEQILDDNKAQNIVTINLKQILYFDFMITYWNFSRHLQALSEILVLN